MSKVTKTIHVERKRLDDYHEEFTIGTAITGFTFALTIYDSGGAVASTISGTVTDGPGGVVKFDPTSGTPNATTLAVGSYTYAMVMTDSASDEWTMAEGRWAVTDRGVI